MDRTLVTPLARRAGAVRRRQLARAREQALQPVGIELAMRARAQQPDGCRVEPARAEQPLAELEDAAGSATASRARGP